MKLKKEQVSSSDSEDSDDSSGPAKTQYNGSVGGKSSDSESDSEPEPSRGPPKSNNSFKSSPQKTATPRLNLSPLEKFKRDNPDYKIVTLEEELSDNDEIAILEYPTTIDPHHFINKQFNLNQKSKIKVDGVKYTVHPNTDHENVLILTKKLKMYPLLGKLEVRAYEKHKNKIDIWDSGCQEVLLPDRLKDRHPIFGTQYQSKIDLNNVIQQKLSSDYSPPKPKKSKKKKKLDNVSSLTEEVLDQSITDLLQKSVESRKNKGKSESEVVMTEESILDKNLTELLQKTSEDIGYTKKKKKKLSETIDNNLNDSKLLEVSSQNLEEPKKKKKKSLESFESLNERLLLEISAQELEQPKKKKKKIKVENGDVELSFNKSMNETAQHDETDLNISTSSSSKKRKRSDTGDMLLEAEPKKVKKAKKLKKEEDDDPERSLLITDILNSIKKDLI